MTPALETDVSPLDPYCAERRIISEHGCNVLLQGTVTATDAALILLRSHIREPIVWHRPPATLDLPSRETGALILSDVSALSRDEQRRLLVWIGDTGLRTQVISSSSRSLFALVTAGLFDGALYYRLNVLLLRVAHLAIRQESDSPSARQGRPQ